jgi:hypothetical protein
MGFISSLFNTVVDTGCSVLSSVGGYIKGAFDWTSGLISSGLKGVSNAAITAYDTVMAASPTMLLMGAAAAAVIAVTVGFALGAFSGLAALAVAGIGGLVASEVITVCGCILVGVCVGLIVTCAYSFGLPGLMISAIMAPIAVALVMVNSVMDTLGLGCLVIGLVMIAAGLIGFETLVAFYMVRSVIMVKSAIHAMSPTW